MAKKETSVTKAKKVPAKSNDLVVEVNSEETLSVDKLGIKEEDTTSNWFDRIRTGIKTSIKDKINIPKGVWEKCSVCGEIHSKEEIVNNQYVCLGCNYHYRISSQDYMDIIFDDKVYKDLFENITPVDILKFHDVKSYANRLKDAQKATKRKDALRVSLGKINGQDAIVSCMDFDFIGGSIGSVMGEKFCRAVDYCIKKKMPYITICKSGGARMMESAFSLLQMPKTCASLHLLAEAKLPYIVVLTDPTYGGITASLGMLGDIHLAEPKARIGFAGPRVIKELIKQELPEDFQTSESLIEKGFIDRIVHRHDLKKELSQLIGYFKN